MNVKPKARGLKLFLMAARARAYPRVWGMKREPSWIFLEIIVPILNAAAYVYLYRALDAPEAYVGFVILGMVMTTFWLNVVWMMASQLHWDKREGFLELYVLAPVSLMAILFGMAAGGIAMSVVRAAIMLTVALIVFPIAISLDHAALALLVGTITIVALYGLGMLLSSLFLLWGREVWQLAIALHEPVFLLVGMNFPLIKLFSTVPGIITVISAIIPISFGLDALRQLLFPGALEGVLPPTTELAILVGLAAMYISAAWIALRRLEWLARVEARLSLRWQ